MPFDPDRLLLLVAELVPDAGGDVGGAIPLGGHLKTGQVWTGQEPASLSAGTSIV
jgi:hypothetical protein